MCKSNKSEKFNRKRLKYLGFSLNELTTWDEILFEILPKGSRRDLKSLILF